MERRIVKATHFGDLEIPGLDPIPCAVLEDGTRVLSERGVTKALGGKRGGAHWRRKKEITTGASMPVFISANNLKDFIDNDLELALSSPIWYGGRRGGVANGVNAAALPKICEVWLKARDAKPKGWTKSQANIARAADILMRGLAHVGVIALVDEATGYQVDRDRAELHAILAAYISKELMPWTSRFPLDFYREMFRLRNWPFSHISKVKGPRYAGKLTNELVYKKLPPGVLDELRRRNPANEKWQRKHKLFQFLTDDIGNPHLEKQVAVVTTLMKVSPNWKIFERNFHRAFPRPGGEQQTLPGIEDDEEGSDTN
jgi:hypothetical protein